MALAALVGHSALATHTVQNLGCNPKLPSWETGFVSQLPVLRSLGEEGLDGQCLPITRPVHPCATHDSRRIEDVPAQSG